MRIGVMCSGNGTNFENIVRSCRKDEVVLMIYNKKNCGAKKRATKLGIPNVCIKSANEDDIIKLFQTYEAVSYTHLRAHETEADLVCRLLLEKKK